MKVVITGASSGIGRETAYLYAERKASLLLVARRRQRLEEVAAQCRARGASQAIVSARDLSRSGEGVALVEEANQKLGGIDLLICNAGYGVYGPVQEIAPEKMARLWQVNFQSGYESIQTALPYFLERREGHIVIVSSVIGKTSLPLASTYCATKFAQVGFAEALWGELRGSGVEVSLICPGYTKTEFQEAAEATPGASMMKRVGGDSAQAVAKAIVAAVDRKKRVVVLTRPGRIFTFMNRIAPNLNARLTAWFVNRARNRAQNQGQDRTEE